MVGVATVVLLVGLVAALAVADRTGTEPLEISRAVVPDAPDQRLAPVAAAPARLPGAPRVSAAWVTRTAAQAGIPEPAVRAYGAATLAENRAEPACHLGWTTLAGIGWVESQHGTIGGRTLGSDGRSVPPVFGPALDGHGDVAAIREYDGSWARAVGPLQFLTTTWTTWASDGDGDGVSDPQDLDDAALAAARYLCAAGGDLVTGSGWVAAVRAYNHADSYVRAVYSAASAYATRTAPD